MYDRTNDNKVKIIILKIPLPNMKISALQGKKLIPEKTTVIEVLEEFIYVAAVLILMDIFAIT